MQKIAEVGSQVLQISESEAETEASKAEAQLEAVINWEGVVARCSESSLKHVRNIQHSQSNGF